MTEAARDLLLVFMQTSVALAGFASLVSVFGRRRGDRELSTIAIFRTRILIETSLLLLFVSYVPILIEAFKVEGPLVWRISSGVALAAMIPLTATIPRRMRALYADPGETQYNVPLGFALTGLGYALAFVMLMNVFGIFRAYGYGVYLIVLTFFGVASGLMFLRIVLAGIGVLQFEVGDRPASSRPAPASPEAEPKIPPSSPEISYALGKTGEYQVIPDREDAKEEKESEAKPENRAEDRAVSRAENVAGPAEDKPSPKSKKNKQKKPGATPDA